MIRSNSRSTVRKMGVQDYVPQDHVSRLIVSLVKESLDLSAISPSGFDIHTFECPACNRVHQRVVGRVDPMKSPKTAGWLRGELRAPT
jgi:hypothetical protein